MSRALSSLTHLWCLNPVGAAAACCLCWSSCCSCYRRVRQNKEESGSLYITSLLSWPVHKELEFAVTLDSSHSDLGSKGLVLWTASNKFLVKRKWDMSMGCFLVFPSFLCLMCCFSMYPSSHPCMPKTVQWAHCALGWGANSVTGRCRTWGQGPGNGRLSQGDGCSKWQSHTCSYLTPTSCCFLIFILKRWERLDGPCPCVYMTHMHIFLAQ